MINNQNIVMLSSASIAVTVTSPSVDLSDDYTYAIQANWNGSSPSGTLTIGASNDNVNLLQLIL